MRLAEGVLTIGTQARRALVVCSTQPLIGDPQARYMPPARARAADAVW